MGKDVTDMGLEVSTSKRELKKHAATIHCSNSLSLLQRKISNALLYHAYKELMIKEEHEITVKQLCRLIGYQGNNHAAIKDALRGLISTIIEWNLIDDETGTENWTASSIIASVSLEGPLCYYAYSPRMKQLLHSPSMFGKIDLVIQSKFRSSYGLALYENCIRYRGLPQTKWFDMDLFKKLMGIPAGMYEVFRDFKKRVLDKAIDEVNTYSDLVISPEYIREGRKVAKVRFKLEERVKRTRLGKQVDANLLANDNEQALLKDKLRQQFKLKKEQIDELFRDYDIGFIYEKIRVVETSHSFKKGRVQNRAAYLFAAIKNDYQAPEPPAAVIDLQNAKMEMELTPLKRVIEMIRLDYKNYREKAIHQVIDSMPNEEKSRFTIAFLEFAEPAIHTILQLQRHKYTRETVHESPQIKALMRQFALRELDIFTLVTLEEFVTTLADERRDAWQKLKSLDPDHPLLHYNE